MESTQLNNMEDNKIEKPILYGDIEEIEDEVEKRFKQFKTFDKISCYYPFDHRYVDKSKRIDPESKVAMKMQLEWEILEKNLPCSIFVRTYEGRFDIMRVAVAGLEGTPYCHGLFFFDIYFPSNYPARPPEIFHRSNDLNSNQRDRKVPTSLPYFNQWYKQTSQKWNPKQSDILQVLVSIQQHVLKGRPYVKESVLNAFSEGQSKKSNKEVFMLNCEAMLCTLTFPPLHFKDLVQGHYRVRAHPILLICKAQMKIINDNALNQLFFKLLKAFEVNGAYCRHHYDISLQEEESSEHQEERSDSNGYTFKFINKFRNML
ncbi:hypothetical protein LWI28_008763 [Acer negundo]|uniref:UBC core domain-containing protein n=1 Tax=Acer negundo TaxID=4023 RepID=A0AAD5IZI0_ACENE|nr:hypothetical protein LWI28_008763 [Acer negundo]